MMRRVLDVFGVGLIVAGFVWWSVPVGLGAAGIGVLVLNWVLFDDVG